LVYPLLTAFLSIDIFVFSDIPSPHPFWSELMIFWKLKIQENEIGTPSLRKSSLALKGLKIGGRNDFQQKFWQSYSRVDDNLE